MGDKVKKETAQLSDLDPVFEPDHQRVMTDIGDVIKLSHQVADLLGPNKEVMVTVESRLIVNPVKPMLQPFADLSSFKIPENILRKIGSLARDAYSVKDVDDLDGLTKEEWTLLEEIITGFENR